LEYLANRTAVIFDTYSSKFLGPKYCPQPPGNVTIEHPEEYKVRVNISNLESGLIKYDTEIQTTEKTDYIRITERNSNFTDKFADSVLDLFKFARDKFADEFAGLTGDRIKYVFENVNKYQGDNIIASMPNSWCQMNGDYCDMTADCKSFPYSDLCLQSTSPSAFNTNCCWGGDCCCKRMYFGDLCGGNLGNDFCEEKLSTYCYKNDVTLNKNDQCNFNHDNVINANEKYNCTAQEELQKPFYNDALKTLEADTKIENCIRVGHKSEFSYSNVITVDWKEYLSPTQETLDKCGELNKNNCGCGVACAPECSHPSCLDSGDCPSDLNAGCSVDSCGYWTCSSVCAERVCQDCIINGQTVSECPPCQKECVEWTCDFVWQCNANACGNTCCRQAGPLYQGAKCTYDYFGTANTSVKVTDTKNKYPIESSLTELIVPFYAVSGNVPECANTKPMEASQYVDNSNSMCCPALTTNGMDDASGCKKAT
jgi:hypothetical protein